MLREDQVGRSSAISRRSSLGSLRIAAGGSEPAKRVSGARWCALVGRTRGWGVWEREVLQGLS